MRKILARTELTTTDRLVLYGSTIAFQWFAVGITAWRGTARGVSLRELGLAYPNPPLTTAVLVGLSVLLSASQIFALRRLARRSAERQSFVHQMAERVMPQNVVESLVFVALVLTVAVCEEFLYRGFVLTVAARAAGGSVLAATLASSILFALAHWYQGPSGLRSTFIVGLIFAVCRVLTGSLAPGVAAHFFTDLIAGLAAPRLLARRAVSGARTAHRTGVTADRPSSDGSSEFPSAR